jgi:hypothetical protein
MTLPISSTGAASALSALSGHAHGHGHKKGGLSSLTDSTDPTDTTNSSTTAAADASSSTTNLFSSLMTSIEQVIGTQPANSTTQAALGQTNTQVAPSTSVLGNAAKSALQIAGASPLMGAVGTAIKLFA